MDISPVTSRPTTTALSDGTQTFAPATPTTSSSAIQQIATDSTDVSVPPPSPEQVTQAVKQVNEAFTQNGQNIYAAIEKDKTTGINVVKVLDKNTREVISQFPSKAIIGLAEAISQSLAKKGYMLHTSA